MKRPTREEQRQWVRQWEETGRELERMRDEKLRDMPYNAKDVDALLALGDRYDGPPRLTSGLEEQQRLFMKKAPEWYKRLRGIDLGETREGTDTDP